MSAFIAELNAALPKPTAGSLPSTRTFVMVTSALESDDVEQLGAELQHTRAHYQSLEYMLNNEDQIVETILGSFTEADELPTPTTVEEAVRYTARVYATEVLLAAYDTAHQLGLFLAMGMNVQEALQHLYSDLDHTDPAKELAEGLTEKDIAELLGQVDDEG
ncbi:hypothetical protein SEA_LAHQTEMISH_54 [Microbacterium phage Lahqtemish]|uniref:hypothetical protein n=1 Tax=Microbacterium phage Lahqtemish TaxID=2776867 RepID=UPI0018A64218|nr:hypothetical protein QDW25_gp54 [Microbacterium phage Lahqtemish]QOP66645.1 hypothetical protein SEA_LAHQTEMISH_54 [Microbacterium phage Lahqtemish]